MSFYTRILKYFAAEKENYKNWETAEEEFKKRLESATSMDFQ